jgi:uncharacterized membrane protein
MSIATLVATVGAGLFAGASTYVTVAEHPSWLESGPTIAIKGLGPSFRRAGVMQGGLATVSLVSAAVAWFQGSGVGWLVGGLLLAVLVPFTLVVIMPTNRRLLDPQLDAGSREAVELLLRWGRLHAVRTVIGVAVFVSFVQMLLRS